MSHNLNLSSYALSLACGYWARLDVDLPERQVGPPARIGTIVHLLAQAQVNGKTVELGDHNPSEFAEAKAIHSGPLSGWIEEWKSAPVPKAVELRLRYDAKTDRAREVPRRGEPGYSRPGPTEVTGELDLVQNFGTHVDVIDIKTGQKRHVQEEQLHAYAVLASRFWTAPLVRVSFLYARKTKTDQTPWVELDLDRIDAEAGRLSRRLRTLPTAEPVPGDHCWRCPLGKANCPAYGAAHLDEPMPDLLPEGSLFDVAR